MEPFAYDAFISYRRVDGARVAHWIRRELQDFRPPKRLRHKLPRPLKIYLDTAYERGTLDFYTETIRPALMSSRFLILLATPSAVARPAGTEDWVRREIEDFTSGPNGRNVMVVRAAGDFDGPLPGDIGQRFPHVQIIDMRSAGRYWRLNPLKASFLTGEMLKLVGPMLALAPEEMPLLRQEEERKQQARIGTIAGVTLATMVATSALAVYALRSSWRAERALESTIFTAESLITRASEIEEAGERSGILTTACDLLGRLAYEADRTPGAANALVCGAEQAGAHYASKDAAAGRSTFDVVLGAARTAYDQQNEPLLAQRIVKAQLQHASILAGNEESAAALAVLESAQTDARRFLKLHAQHLGVLDSYVSLQLAHAEAVAADAPKLAWRFREDAVAALDRAADSVKDPAHFDRFDRTAGRSGQILAEMCVDDTAPVPQDEVLATCERAVAALDRVLAAVRSAKRPVTVTPETTLRSAIAKVRLAELLTGDGHRGRREKLIGDARGGLQALQSDAAVPEDVASRAKSMLDIVSGLTK